MLVHAVSHAGGPVLLFGALPCTGGSPYQHLNWYRGAETRRKIRQHWAVFAKLWRNFKVVAEACRAHGGHVALEWPRSCAYWQRGDVKRALHRWGCTKHHFDGCTYGLIAQKWRDAGTAIQKP